MEWIGECEWIFSLKSESSLWWLESTPVKGKSLAFSEAFASHSELLRFSSTQIVKQIELFTNQLRVESRNELLRLEIIFDSSTSPAVHDADSFESNSWWN